MRVENSRVNLDFYYLLIIKIFYKWFYSQNIHPF